ncbi:uncharacterized protein [Physcomitrium patens]|uniref:uncharacterized protein n=1 Tax=Physcomitrium patens TaxID=3218 RepID=UPI00024B03D1
MGTFENGKCALQMPCKLLPRHLLLHQIPRAFLNYFYGIQTGEEWATYGNLLVGRTSVQYQILSAKSRESVQILQSKGTSNLKVTGTIHDMILIECHPDKYVTLYNGFSARRL